LNRGNGFSEIEGKAARETAREGGSRASFNGANGMNTPCWEAGGWTALVGGNPTERIGRSRVNDMSGGLGSRLGRSAVAVECGGRCRDTNLHPTSCSRTRTTSSEPAPRAAQLLHLIGRVMAEKFDEVFKKARAFCRLKLESGFQSYPDGNADATRAHPL
jgi:hypothetical protein